MLTSDGKGRLLCPFFCFIRSHCKHSVKNESIYGVFALSVAPNF